MSDPAPEQMLELARAAMPDEDARLMTWFNTKGEGYPVIELSTGPDRDSYGRFDPLTNPAHAWAVFKFIGGRYDRNDMDASDWTDGDETLEQVVLRRAMDEISAQSIRTRAVERMEGGAR